MTELEPIGAADVDERVGSDLCPQARDVGLQRADGTGWSLLAPEDVDELISREGTAGDGERIHGILQSADRWVDMGYLDAFATHYRVVALDMLGHGGSDKPTDPDQYTGESHLEDLEAVLDAEGAATCHVWGYSAGAVLALALAAARPERTLATIVGGIPPDLPQELREAVFGPWIEALEAGDWARFWQAFLRIDPPMQALLEKDNDHRAVAAWMRGAVATAELADPGDAPTLVYMGDKEVFFDDARQTAQHLGAEFAAIPGRGHAGAFQDLAAVEPVVRAFLEAVPAVTTTAT